MRFCYKSNYLTKLNYYFTVHKKKRNIRLISLEIAWWTIGETRIGSHVTRANRSIVYYPHSRLDMTRNVVIQFIINILINDVRNQIVLWYRSNGFTKPLFDPAYLFIYWAKRGVGGGWTERVETKTEKRNKSQLHWIQCITGTFFDRLQKAQWPSG